MSDVVKDKDNGTAKVYPVTSDQAWKIAVYVFRKNGTDAIEEHKDEHYMLTSSTHRPFAGAAYMGAWIEPVTDSQTKVTVVTKRKVSVKVTTTLTESGFHSDFAKGVEFIKSGKSLPANQ